MTRVLAISPHLDDAVFSAGGTLARHAMNGDEVTVLTCFTGNVQRPAGFALACQLDKGLPANVDYMALRRTEDENACGQIGARAEHLPFLEAPHRGYRDAAALFGKRLESDQTVLDDLTKAIREQMDRFRPSVVYGPLGVGDHVDHHIVRDVILALSGDAGTIWWEDFPYAMKSPDVATGVQRRTLDPAAAAAKLRGVLCYSSQLAFQFGSTEGAVETLSSWSSEGFADWRARQDSNLLPQD